MTKDTKIIILRILVDVMICFAIFFFPWWVGIVFSLIALFFFHTYMEIIFFGFLLDTLYFPEFGLLKYTCTISGLILFCAELYIKELLRL